MHNTFLEIGRVGRSENFCLVDVQKDKILQRDEILKAMIISYENENLIGVVDKN